MMGNTLTTFHYDNIIQNYQQLQMLLENKKKPVPKETGRACLAAVCQTAGGGALLFGYAGGPAAAGGHVDR